MSHALVETSGSELLAPPCDTLGRLAEEVDEVDAHPLGGLEGVVPHIVATRGGDLVLSSNEGTYYPLVHVCDKRK